MLIFNKAPTVTVTNILCTLAVLFFMIHSSHFTEQERGAATAALYLEHPGFPFSSFRRLGVRHNNSPCSKMDMKLWYPSDFRLAVSNTFSEREVDDLLQMPGCAPRFVYGVLMLPTVLKYYIEMDQNVEIARYMTQATLFGYKLYQFAEESPPVIARSSDPEAAVDGMLIFGLDEVQRSSIYDLEGGLMDLVSVDVEICQKESLHLLSMPTVDAVGTFAWKGSKEGLIEIGSTAWSIDNYLSSQFYDHILRSQNGTWSEAQSQSQSSSGESLRARGGSSTATGGRESGSSNNSRSRFQSSLEQILEEMQINEE